VKALGYLTRREETSLVGGIKYGPNQTLSARVELMPGFSKARFESAGRRFSVAIRILKSLTTFISLSLQFVQCLLCEQ